MLKYRIWRRNPSKTALQIMIACCVLGALLLVGFAVYYMRAMDHAPDSAVGYMFAIIGTLLLILVGVGYAVRKRVMRRLRVRLHTYLAWHMGLGCLALGFIFAHSAGNFNPRSGTYALWGLVALVMSGLLGRVFDRLAPRFATQAAMSALTKTGDDRLSVLANHVITTKQQAVSLASSQQFRQMPHGPSPIEDQLQTTKRKASREAKTIKSALAQEQFFLSLVRVWRLIHTVISIIALGLIVWHIAYAVMLLM